MIINQCGKKHMVTNMRGFFLISFLVLTKLSTDLAHAQPAEIMLAARNGDLESVRALLASGAEPDPKGIATPLYFAAQGGHLEMTKLLLESGADPNAQSKWGSPLQIASRRGHVELATSLLQNGADPNLVGGEFGYAPLHEAAEKGNVDIGRLLISRGANVNLENEKHEPPIHLAVSAERHTFADLLREAGATPIAVDPISSALANADIEKGRARAVECTSCHKLENGTDAIGKLAMLSGYWRAQRTAVKSKVCGCCQRELQRRQIRQGGKRGLFSVLWGLWVTAASFDAQIGRDFADRRQRRGGFPSIILSFGPPFATAGMMQHRIF